MIQKAATISSPPELSNLPNQSEPELIEVILTEESPKQTVIEGKEGSGPEVEMVESESADESSSLRYFNNSSAVSVPYEFSNSSGPEPIQIQPMLAPHPETVPEESISLAPSPRAEEKKMPEIVELPELPQRPPSSEGHIDLPPELPPTSIIVHTGAERKESNARESGVEESVTETPRPLDDIQRWEESLVLMQQQSRKSTPGQQSTPMATPPPLPEPEEEQEFKE